MREERLAEARRFVEFLSAGRDEADTLVRDFLSIPPSSHDEWLAAHPAARSVMTFQLLLDVAEQERALELTDFVARHVASISIPEEATLWRTFLLGRASAIRARALLASGRRAEAIEAYGNAASFYRQSPALQLELADLEAELALIRAEKRASASTPEEELVRELLAEVPVRADRKPSEALAIADRAVALADALPLSEPAGLAQIRAQAHKNRALALRALSRYAEALDALDLAQQILAPHHELAHDQTIVRFARATILDAIGRRDEAAPLIAECRQRFHAEGDVRSAALCEIMESTVLWRVRKSANAHAKLLDVLRKAEALLDAATMAAIQNNLGLFAIDMGDYAEAERRFDEALRLWRQAERPVGVAKSEWGQARALLRKGDIGQAVDRLRAVRERFLEYELVEEAGLAGLEIVEASLAQGKAEEAETLARDIIREFTGAGLNHRAIDALTWLGEAIRAHRASAATVEDVREFIRALHMDPNAQFRATA